MTRFLSTVRGCICCLALAFSMPGLSDNHSTDSSKLSNCNRDRGETLFKKCAVCHTNDSAGEHGVVAPNLYRIVDRPVGKIEGYKFSSVMRKSKDSWTVDLLDDFLKQPMAIYPRTRMAFSGISKDQDRTDLICFLSTNQTTNN